MNPLFAGPLRGPIAPSAASRGSGARPRGSHIFALAAVGALFGGAAVARYWLPDPRRLSPADAWALPSLHHPLGCAEGGVDVASVVASGTVAGVALAASVATVGLVVGLPAGAAVAMRGGRGLRFVLRTCDLVQALPSFLVVMSVLAAVRSPTRVHIALTFSLTAWAPFCRMAVAGALPLRGAGYVEAARALGARGPYTLLRHILPSLVSVGGVQWGATAAAVLVTESALAFLGFAPVGTPSLGTLLEQGVVAMLRAPHVLAAAAVAIALASYVLIAVGRMVGRRVGGG